MKKASISPFFSPKGIGIVGVSRDPGKLGYGLARNLINSGYSGAIHFVNPKGGELFGKTIHTSLKEVPDPVDLAVLLVPPPAVPAAIKDAGERGIKAAIIATGGFRETGPEGAALEEECLQLAMSYGMRLVGPNCIGLVNTHLPLDTTFLQPPGPPAGEIAFVSHSGAICAAVIDWIRGEGIGLSHLVSLGNQADINEAEILPVLAADNHTRVITLYLEGVKHGRDFIEAARAAAMIKPIVAIKVGRFESGRKAAASHTGALAGAEAAFNAAFKTAGVLRAENTEELFQWARTLAWCPLPGGNRVAVLTNAGGPGVTAADALEQHGMKLAELSESSLATLKEFLPPAASLHNPVDMLASANEEHYQRSLQTLLEDPGVDAVLVISPPPPPTTTGAIVKSMIPLIQTHHKPVVFALMGNAQIAEGVSLLRAAQIPDYRFPETAASALGALVRYAGWRRKQTTHGKHGSSIPKSSAKAIIDNANPAKGSFLSSESALDLMELVKIPVSRLVLAVSESSAIQIARKIGYPVVMKVASADISHKSDAGGVLLNVNSDEEVKKGYQQIIASCRAYAPSAKIDGIHIQRMLPAGQEVITGVVRDPQFGPLVMFGSGGIEVEGLKDVAFALAPLSEDDARELIDSTWAGRKLDGFRSILPADKTAVVETLVRLSRLAMSSDEIHEMEINPLRVFSPGKGVCAIDVRIKMTQ